MLSSHFFKLVVRVLSNVGLLLTSSVGWRIGNDDMGFVFVVELETRSWYSVCYSFEMREKITFNGYSSVRITIDVTISAPATAWLYSTDIYISLNIKRRWKDDINNLLFICFLMLFLCVSLSDKYGSFCFVIILSSTIFFSFILTQLYGLGYP